MARQRSNTMGLLATRPRAHVSYDIVRGVEEGLCESLGWQRVKPSVRPRQYFAKAMAAGSMPRLFRSKRSLFMVAMGAYRIADYAADWRAATGKKAVWLFDAWPSSYRYIQDVTKRYGIDLLFVTAKQSAERLNRAIDGVDVEWCPEPLVEMGFKSPPLEDRKVGVLDRKSVV